MKREAVLYLYEFTLLSNLTICLMYISNVLYLYEFTLLSNSSSYISSPSIVLYLYEFTLLSNGSAEYTLFQRSYTSMNLHYSQTDDTSLASLYVSYTSMNLHYSQTSNFENPACNWYVNPHLCYTFLYNKYQHISF